ncbi:DNA-processing protein DprA [Patescibacteria group bacterium]|nr:DNA-processing protein DprA [Patescibacteria group bacterium]
MSQLITSENKYYLLLRYLSGLGKAGIKKLFEQGLTAKQIFMSHQERVKNISLAKKEVDEELEKAAHLGFQLITYADERYPPLLKEIHDPPFYFYIKGELRPKDAMSLAVVGTRRVTGYGREAICTIIPGLISAGLTIVSGMARGADSLVHRAALDAGGRTVAVLGAGLDIIYPPENRELYEEISQNGAVLSEFPLGFEPTSYSFPVRNRLISGISLGVWVIEAPERSGALITARMAMEQNRDVFALPGSIFAQTSLGTNKLIEDGATLVTSAEDIINALNLEYQKAGIQARQYEPETEMEHKVLELLAENPRNVDDLVKVSNYTVSEIGSVLSLLEIKGVIREISQGEYRVV